MKFGVLGPLQVVAGDSGDAREAHAISAARLRALLAVLLWRAGQPVPADELAELVWDGAPPRRAPDATRVLVMRLRRQLDPRAAARIVTRAPGYLIEISDDELDASQFEALTRRAGEAVRAGQWARAARTASEALGLWRGPALTDIPSQFLRDRWLPHLDQLQLQALGWRIEADLRVGGHEQLVPELRDLTARHPLRERFHGQLMLALYRCGRQAEALAAYQHARDVLVAELGVEPGPDLRDLHQRMLVADPVLAAGETGSGPAAPSVLVPSEVLAPPRQLPAGIWHFTGRKAELDLLTAALERSQFPGNDAQVILAITGTAGVGKTALAVHWARQHAGRFPDGQLYADLRGFDPAGRPEDTATVLRRLLAGLGVPPPRIPAETDGQIGLYRSMLAGKRMLIVLDNARDSDQVRPLVSGTAGCPVLVTSRNLLAGLIALDGALPVPVELLTEQGAYDLLALRLEASRMAREPQEAAELITLCARLPLALNIAAAHAVTHPALSLRALCDMLRDARQRLELLSAEPGHADLSAVFSASYDSVSPPAARLFRLLGTHPGPDVSLQAAASIAALPADQARRALDELTRANLVTEQLPGRYRQHDLLRAYAAGQAQAEDGVDGRHSALRRVLDHYLRAALAAARLLSPRMVRPRPPALAAGVAEVRLRDADEARSWCHAELPVLSAAVSCAASAGFAAHAWQLAWAIEAIPDQWRQWKERVAHGEIALAAAGQARDTAGQAYAHRHVGRSLTVGGHPQQARDHLQKAQVMFCRLGDRANQAETEIALALCLLILNEPTRSLARGWHALRLSRVHGNSTWQAAALEQMGRAYAALGQGQRGLAACEQALEIASGIDEPFILFVRADALDSMGLAYHYLGRHDEAIASYRQALSIQHSMGETWLTAFPLDHLGDTYLATGDRDAARASWEQAVSVIDYAQLPGADEIRQKVRDLGPR